MPHSPPSEIEAERQRLAALIEHHLIESLNLLLAQANIYEQTLNAGPQARVAISMLAGLIRQSLQKAQDLQDNLNPTLLESLGLEPALESLTNQVFRSTGLRTQLRLSRLPKRPPYPIELLLYRSVQRLLEHATTHQANVVALRLEFSEPLLSLSYEDNSLNIDQDFLRGLLLELREASARVELRADDGVHLRIYCQFLGDMNLTSRELEVLQLVAGGMSNKEIAARLHLSARTVNFHLDNIYGKMGVNTRTEAAIMALGQGWIKQTD